MKLIFFNIIFYLLINIKNIHGFIFGKYVKKNKLFDVNINPEKDMKHLSYYQTFALSSIWFANKHKKYNKFKLNKFLDHNKKYLAFTPKTINGNNYCETISILVYTETPDDKIQINVDKLLISPYWNKKQISLNMIKITYFRYFNEYLKLRTFITQF